MGGEGTFDEVMAGPRRALLGAAIGGLSALVAPPDFCARSLGLFAADGRVEGRPSDDWIWLGNRFLKAGLLSSSGGALGWLGPAASERNLINHHDRGRLVQQSWYGREDGSDWNGRPWRWNPVQGGDWKGQSARILQRRVSEAHAFVRTQPVHWAAGNVVADALMEQRMALRGEMFEIRYRFEYSGREVHPPQHQELPAVFVTPELGTLVVAEGVKAREGMMWRRSRPGWPNEYLQLVEPWAAWVDDKDWGLGCCVPRASQLTCYRFPGDANGQGACSYFAPIDTLAVVPGFSFEWDVWLTIGTVEEIRERFRQRLTQ